MRGARGFTLIELLVVVVVLVVVTAAVATGIGNIRGASVQTEAGKIAIAVRYLYNLSVLSGRPHRLVIDVDAGAWWGEEQASSDPCESFLLPGDDEPGDDKEGDQPRASFQASGSRLLARTPLEKGIRFHGVMTSHQTQPSDKGQAYVYFFPNGTTENALIWVEGDEDDVMTVEVMALQGNARLHPDKVPVDEFGKQG
jgi:general secretion pathway protein H